LPRSIEILIYVKITKEIAIIFANKQGTYG
jgi:hypothetical protein